MRKTKRKNRTTRNELRYVFRSVGSDLMKVLFMGTPEFAVPSIKAIENDGHEICVVFTQPDRPKGRGHKLTMSPVKEYAVNRGYEVLQPEKVSSQTLVDVIDRTKCDVVVVVAYGQKIRQTCSPFRNTGSSTYTPRSYRSTGALRRSRPPY